MKPGERIKELRVAKDKNQVEFGEIIGYSDAYISEIERSIKRPSWDFLKALEEKFGLSPAYFLYGFSKNRWDAIKRYFESEGLPEESIEKLGPLLFPSEVDRRYSEVQEPAPEYGTLRSVHDRRLTQNASKRELINNVIKILDSENDTITKALKATIEASLYALRFEEFEELEENKNKEGIEK